MLRSTGESPLCSFGHIATHAELLRTFHGQESAIIPFRMGYGRTELLRMGVYICSHLTEEERLAAWCGGHLDCVTVLAGLGLPIAAPDHPHLRFRRGQRGAAARWRADAPLARVHWSGPRTRVPSLEATKRSARKGGLPDRLRMPWREALRQAMTTCLTYAESGELLAAMCDDGFAAEDLAHAITVAPRRVYVALLRLGAIPQDVQRIASEALEREHHS
ncbi:hypothetical protein GCM10022286_26410 [Gryllotalpicola daejeonensis]|uniref:Uncharacterized protein n=1 Tax=Gryllotalpicola daejeonensis TaxID=993087 RepID=A0ABP7ZMI7_9MICO